MSGDDNSIAAYKSWFDAREEAKKDSSEIKHFRLVTPENAEEQLADAMQRGRAFLLLSGTIGVLLLSLIHI